MTVNLKALKPNKPAVIIENYVWTLYGRPKVGKTTLFLEFCFEYFDGMTEKALLVAFEKGYQALNGIFAQDINEWQDFVDLTDQLIDDKEEIPFRFIGFDTVDKMYDYACKFIVKRERIKDKKQYKVIGDIPYGAGYDMVEKEMSEHITRIQKAGYGVMFITHDQDKKFESRDGVSYDKTTVSLPKRARDLIVNMSDFIIFIDNTKVQEGDTVFDERKIFFRADGSDLEAGSRFKNIVPNIPYDAKLMLKAVKEAIEASVGKGTDIQKEAQEQLEKKESDSKEFIDQKKNQRTASEIIAEMQKIVPDLCKDEDVKIKISNFLKETIGTANYTKCDDAESLQKCLDFVVFLKQ